MKLFLIVDFGNDMQIRNKQIYLNAKKFMNFRFHLKTSM